MATRLLYEPEESEPPTDKPYKSYGVAVDEVRERAGNLRVLYDPARDSIAPPTSAAPKKGGAFGRGLGVAFDQLGQTAAGAVALGADALGAEGVRNKMLLKYQDVGDRIGAEAAETDSFSNIESAGDFGEWAKYGAGYLVGQGIQAVGTGGIGALIGKAAIREGMERVVAGQIAKKTEEIIAQRMAQGVVREAAAQGAKEAALKATGAQLGAALGMGALNFVQETGGIYGEAVDEQAAHGGTVDDVNKLRVLGSGAGAALLDTAVDMKNISSLFKATGTGSRAARIAKGGLYSGLREGLTEAAQTGLERYGAGKELTGGDALRDYIDSAALGALGGGAIGAAGGVRTPQAAPAATDPLAQLPEEEISAQPGERVQPDLPQQYAGEYEQRYGVKLDIPTAIAHDANKKADVARSVEALLAQIEGRDVGTAPADPFEGLYASPPEQQPGVQTEAAPAPTGTPPIYGVVEQAQAAAVPPQPTVAQGIAEMTPPDNLVGQYAARAAPPPIANTIATAKAQLDRVAGRAAARGRAAPVAQPVSQAQQVSQGPGQTAVPAQTAQATAAVPPTTPEPKADVAAQMAAMLDPSNPKDSVFIANGTKVPKLPSEVIRTNKKEGIFLTTNEAKAKAIRTIKKLKDADVAAFLSIPETKEAALAATPDPAVVQAKDKKGNVVSEAVTSGTGANEAAVAAQTPPGGQTTVVSPVAAQQERATKVAAQTKPAPKAKPLIDVKGVGKFVDHSAEVEAEAKKLEQEAEQEEAKAKKPAKGKAKPWMPEMKPETANDVVVVKGTDYNDLPARVEVRMVGDKIVDARIVSDDKDVGDVGIKVKKSDTLKTLVARVEKTGDFTSEGGKKADVNAPVEEDDEVEVKPKQKREYPKGTTQQTEEKDAAITRLRRKVRKNIRVEQGRMRVEIERDAPGEERSEWVNQALAPDFGQEQSIDLVPTPTKWEELAKTMMHLFGKRVQFFKARKVKIDELLEGFYADGDPHTLYINVATENPTKFVIGHEFGHSLQNSNPALFADFVEQAMPAMKDADVKKYMKATIARLRREDPRAEDKDIVARARAELGADMVASSWADMDFWEGLIQRAKPEAQPLIARMLKELSAFLKGVLVKMRIIAEAKADKAAQKGTLYHKHLVEAHMKQRVTPRTDMVKDIVQLNSYVRDLLSSNYPELMDTLTTDELAKEAADWYTEKMEPDIPWDQLTDDQQEYWIDSYELYRDGELRVEDRTYAGRTIPGLVTYYNDITKAAKANLTIDKQEQGTRERAAAQMRSEAETYFDDTFAPKKFEDLTAEWQAAFVGRFASDHAGFKVDLKKAGRDALTGMRRLREGAADADEALKAYHEERVIERLDEAAVMVEQMTPDEKAKVALALGHKRWSKGAANKMVEVLSDTIARPDAKSRFDEVPKELRPMVRKLVSNRLDPRVYNRFSFSRKSEATRQTETKQFKDWFGESEVVNGMSPVALHDMRSLKRYEADGDLDPVQKLHLEALEDDYAERNEPKVMYHGTTADVDPAGGLTEFKIGPAGAIFVSPSPAFASKYPNAFEYHRDKPQAVYPFYVRAEKPFDYDKPAHRNALVKALKADKKAFKDLMYTVDGPQYVYMDDLMYDLKLGHWPLLEMPVVQKHLKQLGHDGFYVWEDGIKNLAVYESNQLKAAYGNSGAFSRKKNQIHLSRKGYSPVTEVYATKGGNIVGMASYNATDKTWTVWKSATDIRDDANITPTTHGKTEDALDAMRGEGVRLVRRKASPYMEGGTDAWGRGPDALALQIDNSPKPGKNGFTKSMDFLVDTMNKVWGSDVNAAKLRRDIIRKTQDQYIDIKAVQDHIRQKGGQITGANDLYQALTLYYGKTGARMEAFEKKYSEPMEKALSAALDKGATIAQIEDWLIARHAEERNEKIASRTGGKNTSGSGMATDEANRILAEADTKPYAAELRAIGAIADSVGRFKLQTMLDAGLISQEAHDELAKYKHYVPLKGMDDDDTGELAAGFGIGTGAGFSGKGTLLKFATGRNTKAKHVIPHLLLDAEAKIVRAGKNDVAKAAMKLAEDFPDPKFWNVNKVESSPRFDPESGTVKMQAKNETMDDSVIYAYIDGQRHKLQITDPSMAHALTQSGQAGESEVLSWLRKYNGWLSQMLTTFNLPWNLTNGLRDAQTSYFNLKADPRIPKGVAEKVLLNIAKMKGHRDIWKQLHGTDTPIGQAYKDLGEHGGITHFFGVRNIEQRAKEIVSLENRALGKGLGPMALEAWKRTKTGPKIAEWLRDVGQMVEAVPRVATYMALIDAGWTKADAAEYAKELTVNFNRRGSQKFASAGYLFFNPAMQGTARLYDALKSPYGKGLATAMFGLGLLARLNGGDDDEDGNGVPDYEQLSNWDRSTNVVFSASGLKLPIPYGWNAFYAAGNYAGDAMLGGSPTKAALKALKAGIDAFDPVDIGWESKSMVGAILKGASPTILDPIVEFGLNENKFGSPIYPAGGNRNDFRPDSEQGRVRGPAFWREAARMLNRETNGSAKEKGGIDVNPNTMEHYFKAYLPGLPQEVIRAASAGIKASGSERLEAKDIPGVSRLWATPSKTDYEGLGEAKELLGQLTELSKGDADDRRKLTKYPGWLGVKAVFDAQTKEVAKLYKRKAAVADGKLDVPDEAKEQERLDDEIIKINNRMLKSYNTALQRWETR